MTFLAGLLAAVVAIFPVLPNPRLTPGAVFPKATTLEVCVPGYATRVRNVSAAEKRAVYLRYRIDKRAGIFEVDHLIPLSIGGNNTPDNLWPQSFETIPWNAAVKDKLEVRLWRMVCSGAVSLPVAQRAIRRDWRAAYRTYYDQRPEPFEGSVVGEILPTRPR